MANSLVFIMNKTNQLELHQLKLEIVVREAFGDTTPMEHLLLLKMDYFIVPMSLENIWNCILFNMVYRDIKKSLLMKLLQK